MDYRLIVSGISIEVCKKRIKNLHLHVKPPNGNVTVSAPFDMPDETIERFLHAKINWIKSKVGKFDCQPRQTERNYVTGETLHVGGRKYDLQAKYGDSWSLVLSGEKAILTVRKESSPAQRGSYVREWYRALLKGEIQRLLPKWEQITGLHCLSWQIKDMTTRWGTCNVATRKVWLNLQLAKKSPECLEYVILHELLHLIEKHHNAQFYALMDKFLPMWREVKAMLNAQALGFGE